MRFLGSMGMTVDKGVVGVEERERVVRVCVVVICVAAFLRFGLEIVSAGGPSDLIFVRCAIIVFVVLVATWGVLPLCRNCCSLPLKLVVLLTGTSSAGSRSRLSSSTFGRISVDGDILFLF